MKARVCFFLLCINVSLVLLGSAHNEYGVDHDKDKLDPSYKYKMKGDEILCENIAQKKHLVGVVHWFFKEKPLQYTPLTFCAL